MPEPRSARERLPIKLILPRQGVERRVAGGGPPATPFRAVDKAYRGRLVTQLDAILSATFARPGHLPAAPAQVKLHPKAMAKSHRPNSLFSEETCPIIGAGSLGELFVKVTLSGLSSLEDTIRSNTTDKMVKEISCVDAIEPITPTYRRKGLGAEEILRTCPRSADGFMTRVRLFSFGGGGDEQSALVDDLHRQCRMRKLRIDGRGYSVSSYTYAVECRTTQDVEALSRVMGVKSVSRMPLLKVLRPAMLHKKPVPALPASDKVDGDYPVVVVVDTGISKDLKALVSCQSSIDG